MSQTISKIEKFPDVNVPLICNVNIMTLQIKGTLNTQIFYYSENTKG
jgi:hypothetical protein